MILVMRHLWKFLDIVAPTPRVQTFKGHPPSYPETIEQIKKDFLEHAQTTWLIKKPEENTLPITSDKVVEHAALWGTVSRLTDRLLNQFEVVRKELEWSDGNTAQKRGVIIEHRNILADETALAHAQLIEIRDTLGLDIDVDKIVKQVYFEVAARYQATFEAEVMQNKGYLNPERSHLWQERLAREEAKNATKEPSI